MGYPPPIQELIATYPGAQSYWDSLQGQLNIEVASQDEIGGAATLFASEVNNLSQKFQADTTQVFPAATQFVKSARTAVGAVEQVGGLVASAISGNETPAQLVQTTVGVICSFVALTAPGIGTAIAGVIGVLDAVLSAAGLFGSNPKGTTIQCGNNRKLIYNPAPDQLINCTARWGKPIPQSMNIVAGGKQVINPYWVKFPKDQPRAYWDKFTMDRLEFIQKSTASFSSTSIFDTFPKYDNYLKEKEHPYSDPSGITQVAKLDFIHSFWQAWKINCERLLNGHTGGGTNNPNGPPAVADSDVLAHALRMFNAAHQSAGNKDWILNPDDKGLYLQTLINDMIISGNTTDTNGSGIIIHMGEPKQTKLVIPPMHLRFPAPKPPKVIVSLGAHKVVKHNPMIYSAAGAIAGGVIGGPPGAIVGGAAGLTVGNLLNK